MVLASDYAAVYVQQWHLDQLFRIQLQCTAAQL